MNRRGLTLIELLLAIGLVLIAGALVLPAIFTGLRERSFESGAEVVRNQLLLARAHAQVTRRPVEVMYENKPPRKPGVRARYFLVDAPTEQMQRTSPGGEDDPLPIDELLPANPEQVIVEGWADRDLPGGLRFDDPSEPDQAPVVLRLAVYMPDGSAPLAQPVRISDDHGRRGTIEVNPWTGLPSFRRSAGADDDAGPAPDDPADEQDPETEP